ncbi:MAG TPA: ABC transporter permease, partial [Chloroflexi bacterium]|nr:ABC transporter permease [Chloroflexota bacterium]
VTDPEVHQLQQIIDALRVILTVLGGLSLALSAFLIVNMMNATVAQQVWQIGVMKVVGATTGRIMRLYLGMALMYGMLAIAIAVPTSAVAAYLLAGLLLDLFNMTIGSFQLMPMAVGVQILMAILVPLLAALVPVLNGARISPHQAISNYGLGAGFGQNWLDRLIGRIRHLPRPLTLSLRNSFRRKVRVALTMLTLVMGGVMFVMVLSVGSSMNNTIEVLLQDLNFDVLVIMRRFYRVNRLISIAESTPGVVRAEVWNQLGANLELKNGDEREVFVWGVPPDSQVFNPRIISGRPLLPEDGRAILLNSKIAADEGFDVGDEITLNINDRESTWTVVGLILNINNLQRDNFVPFDVLSREEGFVNQGILVMIMTEGHDQATHQRMVREIRNVYEANRLEPLILQSAAEVRQTNKLVFNAIVYVMLAMAILAAIVGSVGLMSTMSINVVERSREIGVMRAVGATSVTIVGIFIAEGVLVGWLSWLIAVPLSYPGALLFNNLVSQTLFEIPLDFDYSGVAIILWWIIVTGLSAIASLWPALNATQVSVREALAYE